jgi:hypothetical protein
VEEEEPTTACPFCHVHGPETELECTACKNVIPYCIATGRRMVLGDWAHCPACRFPCRGSVFVKLISADRACPMCHKEVQLSQVGYPIQLNPLYARAAALCSSSSSPRTAHAPCATRRCSSRRWGTLFNSTPFMPVLRLCVRQAHLRGPRMPHVPQGGAALAGTASYSPRGGADEKPPEEPQWICVPHVPQGGAALAGTGMRAEHSTFTPAAIIGSLTRDGGLDRFARWRTL